MKKVAKKATKKKTVRRKRRNAFTGRYVTDQYANLHPATTVAETEK